MPEPRFPRDLSKMTPEQVEQVIVYYVSLPFDELRWRQERANADARRAFQAAYKELPGSPSERALANVQITVDLLSEAVGRQTWPDDFHNVIDVVRYRV